MNLEDTGKGVTGIPDVEQGELLDDRDQPRSSDPQEPDVNPFSWTGFAVGCAMNAAIKVNAILHHIVGAYSQFFFISLGTRRAG